MKRRLKLKRFAIRWCLVALAALSVGCTVSSDGSDSPTFSLSFGGPSKDSLVDLGVDGRGGLWVVGQLRSEDVNQSPMNATTPLLGRPWLASLDSTGDTAWERSPATEEGYAGFVYKHGEAFPDGGALFAGDVESRSGGIDIRLQRADASGNILWTRQLDGTATWEGLGLQFDPSRPGSDEVLSSVIGDEAGWWVVANSSAYGFDAGKEAAFGAPSVFAWFIEPNGTVRAGSPLIFSSVDKNRLASQENRASALSTVHVASTLLEVGDLNGRSSVAFVIRITSAVRDVDQLSIAFGIQETEDTITSSVVNVESPFGVPGDKTPSDLIVETAKPTDSLDGFEAATGFLHLLGPKDVFGDQGHQLVKFDGDRAVEWTLDFNDSPFTEVNAIAQTKWLSQTGMVRTAQSWMWAAGSREKAGEQVPVVWRISAAGAVDLVCEPTRIVAIHQATTVVALERVAPGDRLRVLMRTSPVDLGEAALLEVTLEADCEEVVAERRLYLGSDNLSSETLDSLPSRPRWSSRVEGAGPAQRTLNLRRGTTIYRFDSATGDLADSVSDRRQQAGEAALSGLAVTKSGNPQRKVVLTNDSGQIKQFDENGEYEFNLGLVTGVRSPLLHPAIDNTGSVWAIGGNRGASLLRLDTSLNAFRLQFDECFWLSEGERDAGYGCIEPEFISIDDGSIDNGFIHAVGRGRTHARSGPRYRYFLARFDVSGSTTVPLRYLPQEVNDLVISEVGIDNSSLSIKADSMRALGDDVTLVNIFQAFPLRAPSTSDPIEYGPRNAFKLYHYGATAQTRWSLDTRNLALQEAKLAHDGGAVLLIVISGKTEHELSSAAYQEPGIDHNVGLLKLDAEGHPQWLRVYGTATTDVPLALRRTLDGYVIAAVSRGVDAVTPGSQDLWVLKVGPDGRIAGDAQGTELCQAGLASFDGEATFAKIDQLTSGGATTLTEPLATGSTNYRLGSVDVVTLPTDSSALQSENTARQCSGSSTDEQEPAFDPNAVGVPITINLSGRVGQDTNNFVQSQAGPPLTCVDNVCTGEAQLGSTIVLEPVVDANSEFDNWGACASDPGFTVDPVTKTLTINLIEGVTAITCEAVFGSAGCSSVAPTIQSVTVTAAIGGGTPPQIDMAYQLTDGEEYRFVADVAAAEGTVSWEILLDGDINPVHNAAGLDLNYTFAGLGRGASGVIRVTSIACDGTRGTPTDVFFEVID